MSSGLAVEATSHDDIIEAIRPASGERVLAVQWHPEWRAAERVDSLRLFAWFGMLIRGASLEEAADRVSGLGPDLVRARKRSH
jgi:putative glutamine amidotransferase